MQYFTIKYADYTDRAGIARTFDMATAPLMSDRSVRDDLARFVRLGVAAEIVPVPPEMAAARRATVRISDPSVFSV